MSDDIFGMDPVDDGAFGSEPSHTEGTRFLLNEVGDYESETFFRERAGPEEDHGIGAHVNFNSSIENDVTGGSIEVANNHSFTDEL